VDLLARFAAECPLSACQLHFNKAFLKTLIARLQSADQLAAAGLSAAAAELGAAVA
jgi:hypothetical protein